MERSRGLLVLLISLVIWSCNGSAESRMLQDDLIDTLPMPTLDLVCNHGDEVCDEECFNPVTEICYDNAYGMKRACARGYSLCGWQCLANNDTSRMCVDNQVCERGQALCSFQCYSPEIHHCLNGNLLCPIGEVDCGYTCYNPEDKSKNCHQFEYNSYLCKANEKACGAWGCYDPETHKCDEQEERLCPIDATICGFSCASEARGEICIDNKQVCQQEQSLCGYKCYTPSKGEVCRADNLVCKIEEELCGTSVCYDPTAGQTCHDMNGGKYHKVCQPGFDYCHYSCYDKNKQDCVQPDPDSNYKKVCPKGYAICHTRLIPYYGAYTCYNPSTKVCITNDRGTALCNIGQDTCGNTCYSPAEMTGKRCFEKSGVICKSDEEACGKSCYNNATKICFEDVLNNIQLENK